MALCSACAGKATNSADGAGGSASSGGASSGGASSGGAASGGAGNGASGGTSSGGSGAATPSTIVLTNGSDEAVWVQTAGRCANIPVWFNVVQEDTQLAVVGHCITDCATYDPELGPAGCPAICLLDEYEELAAGASIEFDWDGASWVSDPRGCSERTPVPLGTSLDVEFCVVDGSFVPDGSAGEGPDPTLVSCDQVKVTYGASGTIEYVFDGL